MSNRGTLNHYGREPHLTAGPEAIHSYIHERAVNKTIARVYLGGCEPIPDLPQSEYVVFEITDGTTLMLQVASGYSFHVGSKDEAQEVIARANQRATA